MRTLATILALTLTAFVGSPAHAAASCPTDAADIDVAGLAYMHVADRGDHEGEQFFYAETNGIGGLQYGMAHHLFGWSEMDGVGAPCTDGDHLIF